MDSYTPFNVYENLIKMLKYRNITLRGDMMTEEQVAQRLNFHEMVAIVGDRRADPIRGPVECHIFLFSPGSKYSAKSQEFKKVLKGLPTKSEHLEVIFVSKDTISVHLQKQLDKFKTANPTIYVEDYDYEKFSIEVPKHVSVPHHELATPAEIQDLCRDHYTVKERFPKILTTDTMAVWIGAKPGMVVKIQRVSELTGNTIAYRYVK